VPGRTLGRMLANVGLDYLVGLVPLLGDLADLAWKANRRNALLLRDHLVSERAGREAGAGRIGTEHGRPAPLTAAADRRDSAPLRR
jgi:Domain of unknown function (DUF4112)